MDKLKINNSQVMKLFLIASLLIITPLLPTSRRSTYLYFIANILIIVVGAEAGLFSFLLEPPEYKTRPNSALALALINDDEHKEKESSQVRTSRSSADKVSAVKETNVRKSPSTPSIFFIGAEAEEFSVEENDVQRDEVGEVSGQELFQKAETFIGNFYKQLKMQREESWKKLHDLYQKAF